MAKIAVVLNSSWNIFNFRLPLMHHLAGLGHEIVAMAPEDDYSSRIPFPFFPVQMEARSTGLRSNIRTHTSMRDTFSQIAPDIALLYTVKPNVFGNFAARKLGIRTISNIAGLGTLFVKPGIKTAVVKQLYSRALTVPDKVFFQNREDQQMFVQQGLVRQNQVEHMPGSGVDLDRFAPRPLPRDPDQPFVFLLCSRMLWDKGIREFVEAASELGRERSGFECRLLGFLDDEHPGAISANDMENLIKDTPVSYWGTTDEVETHITQADCVVLPSYYREGVPRILLEAAAMGKPLITTKMPGCAETVVEGENGFLCEPRSAADLLEKMRSILDSGAERLEMMGKRSREIAEEKFDQKKIFAQYERAIKEIGC